jgi:hypothetical protein
MPTNKEITEWLREAAATHQILESKYSKSGWLMHSHDAQRLKELFVDRAALVESMTCSTCKWWEELDQLYSGICDHEGAYHPDFWHDTRESGPQFVCVHWCAK